MHGSLPSYVRAVLVNGDGMQARREREGPAMVPLHDGPTSGSWGPKMRLDERCPTRVWSARTVREPIGSGRGWAQRGGPSGAQRGRCAIGAVWVGRTLRVPWRHSTDEPCWLPVAGWARPSQKTEAAHRCGRWRSCHTLARRWHLRQHLRRVEMAREHVCRIWRARDVKQTAAATA